MTNRLPMRIWITENTNYYLDPTIFGGVSGEVLSEYLHKEQLLEVLEGMRKPEIELSDNMRVVRFSLMDHNAAIDAMKKVIRGDDEKKQK